MTHYLIDFWGTRNGSIGHFKERVSRIVEAADPEAARLKAYETHEHIDSSFSAHRIRWWVCGCGERIHVRILNTPDTVNCPKCSDPMKPEPE